MRQSTVALCAGLVVAACGGSQTRFPSQSELEALRKRPAKTPDLGQPDVVVDAWTLAGPFPDAVGEVRGGEGPFQAMVASSSRAQAGVLLPTAGMTCFAREYARFHVAHGGSPTEHLRDFMAARCGAPNTSARVRTLHGDTGEDEDAAALIARWRDDLRQMIDDLQGNLAAGAWLEVTDGKAVAVLASRKREAFVEPVRMAEDGTIRLVGEILVPAERVSAFVNQGTFGVAECAVDDGVRLPAFRIDCPGRLEDPLAWFSVAGYPAGRLLGDTLLHSAVAGPDATAEYTRPGRTDAREVGNARELGEAFVRGVNALRADAGLGPLAFDTGQSLVATDLAPHYFDALWGERDPLDADRVALGMMAGWSVEADVLEGHHASEMVVGTHDVGQMLDVMADDPWHRWVLLDAKASRIAVGPIHWEDPGALATLVGVYATADDSKEARIALRGAARRRIMEARRAKGRKEPDRIAKLENRATPILDRLASGEYDPEEAYEAWQSEATRFLKKGSSGWILYTNDPAQMEVPDALLDAGIRQMAVVVGRYRGEEDPWHQYVVLVMFPYR